MTTCRYIDDIPITVEGVESIYHRFDVQGVSMLVDATPEGDPDLEGTHDFIVQALNLQGA